MKAIRNFWESIVLSIFKPALPLPAGVYHYQSPKENPKNYRLHLRLNPKGDGLLIINASTVLHLNQSAAEFAYYIVNQTEPTIAAEKVARRYHVSFAQAIEDFNQLSQRIDSLINTQDLDPVTFLDFEETNPYHSTLSAPLRLDCAITYQNDEESEGLSPKERVKTELTLEQWKVVLDKAWQAGIPHVIFTGGEPTLRGDLAELITYAEQLGMVSGILTSGRSLLQPYTLNQLLQSGLDHIMILLNPESEWSWRAIQKVVPEDLFLTVHLTLTAENHLQMEPTLYRLEKMGVRNISLSTIHPDLAGDLQRVRQVAADLGLSLVTELPVPYSQFNPVAFEISGENDLVSGSGTRWLYVEPDGDILPAQGIQKPMGNLVTDSWEMIWENKP